MTTYLYSNIFVYVSVMYMRKQSVVLIYIKEHIVVYLFQQQGQKFVQKMKLRFKSIYRKTLMVLITFLKSERYFIPFGLIHPFNEDIYSFIRPLNPLVHQYYAPHPVLNDYSLYL